MSNNSNNGSCRTNSWLAAIVLGILGFLLAWQWLGWGFFWSILAGLVVFFVLGYLLIRMFCRKAVAVSAPVASTAPASVEKPAPTPAPAEKPAPTPAAAAKKVAQSEGGKPAALEGPRGGTADDLKKIKGVGPGLEKTLNENGIWHYDQIAGWSVSDVAYVDDHMLRFKGRATRDSWVEQAATLAKGGDTAFSKKVDKGGVY